MGNAQHLFARFLLLLTKIFLGGRRAESEVLSRSPTREATRIYEFITNNHASFHLWQKQAFYVFLNSLNC